MFSGPFSVLAGAAGQECFPKALLNGLVARQDGLLSRRSRRSRRSRQKADRMTPRSDRL